MHNVDSGLAAGKSLERWELILEVLESGEMPPEEEAERPDAAAVGAVTKWIEAGLRKAVAQGGETSVAPQARRATNFEYENTIRDLIGFRLKLTDNLPKDPEKPYHFNNTAEFMLLGPEQVDRYLENARKVMASAIVDPEKPEVHKARREWQGHGLDRGMGLDEIGVWGNRRHSASGGMGLKSFPSTGEFVIRVQASAILPPGVKGAPLRLIMGQTLNGSTQRVEPVGSAYLDNSPDEPRVLEFRGRIENYPLTRGRMIRGNQQPDSRVITPQVLYDDGTLNDGNRNLTMPRIVINWMEFEAPVADVWPPAHHRRILFDSPLRESDPEAYVREVIRRFASRAFRRPASEAEVKRFEQIYRLVLPELKTMESAMRETLAMVLISPQFLYHTVADGEVTHRQYELASRLSYFLWGSMPDKELMELAGQGGLDDPKVMEQQTRRLLADARSQDFVRNFTMQWLSLAKMKTVPINQQLFPAFSLLRVSRRTQGHGATLPADDPRLHAGGDHRLRGRVDPPQCRCGKCGGFRVRLAEPALGRALRCAGSGGKPLSRCAVEVRASAGRLAYAGLDVDRQWHWLCAASDLSRGLVAGGDSWRRCGRSARGRSGLVRQRRRIGRESAHHQGSIGQASAEGKLP